MITVNSHTALANPAPFVTEVIDTTTPGGRLVFHLFAALGPFEGDLIRERTQAGRVRVGKTALYAALATP